MSIATAQMSEYEAVGRNRRRRGVHLTRLPRRESLILRGHNFLQPHKLLKRMLSSAA